MMNTNETAAIDMYDFDAWSKHVNEEFNRIMQEYDKVKKEIEEEGSSVANGIGNGKVMLDHMMLTDQQNRMFEEENRRITEQNNLAIQQQIDQQSYNMFEENRRIAGQNDFATQQNAMVINMLHHGF